MVSSKLSLRYGLKMVFFEITRLEGDLKIKAKLSESKRLEFEKAKRLKERQKLKAQKIKEEKERLIREKYYEKLNRKRARELRAEKKQEQELLLEKQQEKEKRIEVLRIEEQRIINTSAFMLSGENPYDFSDPFDDTLMELKKRDMLERVKSQIEMENWNSPSTI